MKLSTTLKRVLGGTALVAAFALLISAALPGVASAHGGPGGLDRGVRGADGAYLADALGVTADELQAAHEAAADAAIDQAVAEGLITEAQAEAIRERSGRFDGKMLGRFALGADTIDMEALLAAELGISVDDLDAAKDAAQEARLAQAVEDGKITQEQADEMSAMRDLKDYLDDSGLQDNIRSLREQAIQDAVDAGVISQELADQILEGDGFGMRSFDGRGHGMRGPRRGGPGMRGFGGQGFAPRSNSTTIAPTFFSL